MHNWKTRVDWRISQKRVERKEWGNIEVNCKDRCAWAREVGCSDKNSWSPRKIVSLRTLHQIAWAQVWINQYWPFPLHASVEANGVIEQPVKGEPSS